MTNPRLDLTAGYDESAPLEFPTTSIDSLSISQSAAQPFYESFIRDKTIFAGKYLLKNELGHGGFGVVYLAWNIKQDKACALKFIRPHLLRQRRFRDLFTQECRLWIAIDPHPYVVAADWIQDINGQLLVQMEYVAPDARNRTTMKDHLDKCNGPLDTPTIAKWAAQICLAMEHATEHGIACHRDLKPSNILIGDKGSARVSDFGIAAAITPTTQENQRSEFGTQGYIAPEISQGGGGDALSDIYSFGVILWQLLTGSRLAPKNSILAWHPRPVDDVDRLALCELARRCLLLDRKQRPQSFLSIRTDLQACFPQVVEQTTLPLATQVKNANSWSNKGASLHALGRDQQARECCRKALEIDVNHARAWNNLADICISLTDYVQAMSASQHALSINPGYAAAHLSAASAACGMGQMQQALQSCDLALGLDPLDATAWMTKGAMMLTIGQLPDSIDCFKRSLELDPYYAGAETGMGDAHLLLGNRLEAAKCYRRACQADPFDPVTWNNLGNCLNQLNEPNAAADAYFRSVEVDDRYAPAWGNLGVTLLGLNHEQDAVACLEKSVTLDPMRAGGWTNLGNLHLSRRRFEQAMACYRNALAADSRLPAACHGMGTVLLELGQAKLALLHFDRALEADPNYTKAEQSRMDCIKRLGPS